MCWRLDIAFLWATSGEGSAAPTDGRCGPTAALLPRRRWLEQSSCCELRRHCFSPLASVQGLFLSPRVDLRLRKGAGRGGPRGGHVWTASNPSRPPPPLSPPSRVGAAPWRGASGQCCARWHVAVELAPPCPLLVRRSGADDSLTGRFYVGLWEHSLAMDLPMVGLCEQGRPLHQFGLSCRIWWSCCCDHGSLLRVYAVRAVWSRAGRRRGCVTSGALPPLLCRPYWPF